MARIVLDGVSKVYPDGTSAVETLNLEIPDGQLTVLVGPSGCGKTTVLMMVAGLEELTGGTIRIGEQVVNDVLPKDRDIAMVFQNYALYPHMSVYRNLAFGLRMRKVERGEIDRRVREAARILSLTDDLLQKRPKQLSGGQRQRVAMGRAMVRDPQAFLMDEPLSNLDAKLRVEMRAEIAELQRELGVTTIYVTHDQTEAMVLGHNLALMNGGTLQQVGAPQDVYDAPANLFVASFIGSPAMNLAEADLVSSNGSTTIAFGDQRLRASEHVFETRPALRSYAGKKVIVGIRPEDLEDASLAPGAPADRRLRVSVSLRESMGPEAFLHFPVKTNRVPVTTDGRAGASSDDTPIDPTETTFVARVTARTKAGDGDDVELVVDMDALHFFDPATGERIST
ncbi:MAG: ABC transporter ATP-binding protein [Actinomycetota bacterium]